MNPCHILTSLVLQGCCTSRELHGADLLCVLLHYLTSLSTQRCTMLIFRASSGHKSHILSSWQRPKRLHNLIPLGHYQKVMTMDKVWTINQLGNWEIHPVLSSQLELNKTLITQDTEPVWLSVMFHFMFTFIWSYKLSYSWWHCNACSARYLYKKYVLQALVNHTVNTMLI